MARQGTPIFAVISVSGGATSGMRFRNFRLIAPITALKAKMRANCHGREVWPRHAPARRKAAQLATWTHVASRARYLPRTARGTRVVIQGSQAALEMPRERLNPNNNRRSSASCVAESRKLPARGTRAMQKMNRTRKPQPA
jgi:hypothetical protein